jgi:hypothetical protein
MEVEVRTPALPSKITDNFLQSVQRTVMCLWRGKTNNIGVFTIPTSVTQVKVTDSRVTPDSHISITGLDNNSQAGVLSITERNSREGYFMVGCPAGQTERNFSYAIIG